VPAPAETARKLLHRGELSLPSRVVRGTKHALLPINLIDVFLAASITAPQPDEGLLWIGNVVNRGKLLNCDPCTYPLVLPP